MTIDSPSDTPTPDNGTGTGTGTGTGPNYPDRRIAEFYQAQSLSSERLGRIVADQVSLADNTEPKSKTFPAFYALAASVVAICSLLAGYIVYGSLQDTSTQRISVAVNDRAVTLAMREAALNHTTKLKFDYQPKTLIALQSSMDKLPFDITLPQSINPYKTKLVGARYCSIEGELAAHLRFVDTSNQREFSIFMASAGPSLNSLAENEARVDDVAVRLWREQNILYLETTTIQ